MDLRRIINLAICVIVLIFSYQAQSQQAEPHKEAMPRVHWLMLDLDFIYFEPAMGIGPAPLMKRPSSAFEWYPELEGLMLPFPGQYRVHPCPKSDLDPGIIWRHPWNLDTGIIMFWGPYHLDKDSGLTLLVVSGGTHLR